MADEAIINVVTPEGRTTAIPLSELAKAQEQGYRIASGAEVNQAQAAQKYGEQGLATFGEGLARTLSFGLSDVNAGPEVALRKQYNPGSAIGGELTGMVLPVGAPGLIGAAGRGAEAAVGGTGLVEGLLSGGTAARAAGAAIKGGARAATEGALYGAGQTVSDLALSDDPINAEAIASHLGTNMLYGGLTAGVAGAGLNALGSVARSAAVRARNAGTKAADALATDAAVPADVAGLDAAGIKAARAEETASLKAAKDAEFSGLKGEHAAELEALQAGKKEALQGVASDLVDFREQMRVATDRATKDETSLAGLSKMYGADGSGKIKGFIAAERKVDSVLDAVTTRPKSAIEAMNNVERTGLTARKAFDDALAAKGLSDVPEDLATQLQRIDDAVTKARALRSQLEQITAAPASAKLSDLEGKLAGFDRSVASDRLAALDARAGQLANPSTADKLAGLVQDKAASGAAAMLGGWVGGPLGAAAGMVAGAGLNALKKRLGTSAADFAQSIGEKLDTAFSRASTAAPEVASKIAVGLSFGAKKARDAERDPLHQVALDVLDATSDMAGTQQRIHDSLLGLRAVEPAIAEQVEKLATMKLQYLASVAPKTPPIGAVGQDRGTPSAPDLRKFAAIAAVVDNPLRVLDHLTSDTLTPAIVKAAETIAPATFKRITDEAMQRLATTGDKLSAARRLGLAMLTGSPIVSTLKSDYIAATQRVYATMRAEAARNAKKPGASAPSHGPDARKVLDSTPTAAQQTY